MLHPGPFVLARVTAFASVFAVARHSPWGPLNFRFTQQTTLGANGAPV